MASRHLARSIAMQVLYEIDFWSHGEHQYLKDSDAFRKHDELIKNAIEIFAPDLDASGFIEELVEGVANEQERIDALIEKSAPDWPLAQITLVDRNVLRIGIFELLWSNRDAVPPKVAINEAIELAKEFWRRSVWTVCQRHSRYNLQNNGRTTKRPKNKVKKTI